MQGQRLRRYGLHAGLAVLLLPGLLPRPLPAAPETGLDPASAGAGSLLLRMRSGYESATRINTEIDINVSGMIVHTSLRQVFRNDGSDWVEGIYVFPLPEGAALNRMRLAAGERVIEGEIREKQEAQADYEQARSQGKRASLVRQQRANLFTTSVANVAPGETVTVEIGYVNTARFVDGTFSLRFPMTLTPRYIPGEPTGERQESGWSPDTDRMADASLVTPPMIATSGEHRISIDARIVAGIPLAYVASRYHPVEVSASAGGYYVRFAQKDVVMDHDFELLWRPVRARSPRAMLFSEVVDGRPHLLVMLVPPDDGLEDAEVPPRELVFVIDTSGSMHGGSLAQAQASLLLALDGLRPADRFNVIQFNSVTSAMYARSTAAAPASVAQAKDYVRGLAANGGTEMRPALDAALALPPESGYLKQIVFITDGSVGNEDELFQRIDQGLSGARLFTVGIGSAPNGWLLRKAAEVGRGRFVTISALHEVEEKMGRLLARLEWPTGTDIEMEWPAGLEAETYPARIPDLYAGEPVLVRARLARAPAVGEELVLRGRTPAGDWRAELDIGRAEPGAGTATVWARARVAELMDRERRGMDAQAVRQAVIDTALRHRLVSKYTGFVAVDRTPIRPDTRELVADRVPNLVPHGQSMQAIFGFPATATAGPARRRNGALLLGLGAILLFVRVWALQGPGRDEN